MNIDWQRIEHKDQRYPTTGDWYFSDDGNTLFIRVSRLSSPRYEFCLGLHELVEAMLCWFAGITQADVDRFDMPYEEAYQHKDPLYPCGCARIGPSDPGGDRHCPYAAQHRIADAVERVVAAFLGVRWADYDKEVDEPPQ